MSSNEAEAQHWLVPELDLQTQLRQELDRRTAARLSRDELSELVDKLIVDWYHHNKLIDNLLGRVRRMEVDLVLRDAKPSTTEPADEYYEWVREMFPDI